MNRGFGFALAIPIFICTMLVLLITSNVRNEQQDYEEYVLALQVDYATDAAAEQLLEGANLGLDYQAWGRVQIDPDEALKTFQTVMLLNQNIPLTDDAYDEFAQYQPFFCVAAYDGYYVYEQYMEPTTKGYVLKPTPKMPYMWKDAANDIYYNLNLGLENCRRLEDGTLTLQTTRPSGYMGGRTMTQADVLYEINAQISDDLACRYTNYQLNNTGQHENSGATFYIPFGLTSMTQVNAVEGPSVISIIDNWQGAAVHELSTFSIGGARLEPTRQVACYTIVENGVEKNYYAYADVLPSSYQNAIVDLVPGQKQAAEKGFFYDFYFSTPVVLNTTTNKYTR